jgi:3-methyladenine DNA glycosylase AlkD
MGRHSKSRECRKILKELKSQVNPDNVAGMVRFGINPKGTYGISIPVLRRLARVTGKNHQLALELWSSGIHEARILAAMVDDPASVTAGQMDDWVKDFDSWDVCDQCCSNLFRKTEFARAKCVEWASREEEFVKRAAFALMASMAAWSQDLDDQIFESFFPLIENASDDSRNFVKKAVNWALRQIGKRNASLRRKAIRVAERIQKRDSRSAKWIASDALRELQKSLAKPPRRNV